MIRVGFHMSVAGGVRNSALNAGEAGYGTFQIFTSSPRSWNQKTPEKEDAELFKKYVKEYGSVPNAHIPYLCNLASPKKDVLIKSKAMLKANIRNCNILGIRYLVLHLGSHLGEGMDFGISSIVDSLKEIVDSLDGLTLLLENTSGYTNNVGSKFEEIGRVIKGVGSRHVGMCLDTCHMFAAGYDIRTEKGVDEAVAEIDRYVGLSRMKLVHLNDSKFELGSTKDRHWHIGKGHIGENGFVSLFKNNAFRDGCFVMETPSNSEGDDETNLAAVMKIMKRTGLKVEEGRHPDGG